MTQAHREAREERIAIMIIDGKVSEASALKYINSHPELFGIEGVQEQQEGFGFKDAYQYR